MDLPRIPEEDPETAWILVLENVSMGVAVIQVWHQLPSKEIFLHHKIKNHLEVQFLLHHKIKNHPEVHQHLQYHKTSMMLVTLGFQRVGLLGKIKGPSNLLKEQDTEVWRLLVRVYLVDMSWLKEISPIMN